MLFDYGLVHLEIHPCEHLRTHRSSLPSRGPCRSSFVIFPFNDNVALSPFSADSGPDKLASTLPFCPAFPLCICVPVISLKPVMLTQ